MPICNLLEYSYNYSITSEGLWNYHRDKIDDVDLNDNVSDSKSFKCKIKIVGETPERLPKAGYLGYADQPAPPLVPCSSVEVSITLKGLFIYPSNYHGQNIVY